MRLHLLLLLLSAFYLAPTFCQGGGFRVGRSAEPTALEILEKQAAEITNAIRNKDRRRFARLFYHTLTQTAIDKMPMPWSNTFLATAEKARFEKKDVFGAMLIFENGVPMATVNLRLRKHSGSPTGWKIANRKVSYYD